MDRWNAREPCLLPSGATSRLSLRQRLQADHTARPVLPSRRVLFAQRWDRARQSPASSSCALLEQFFVSDVRSSTPIQLKPQAQAGLSSHCHPSRRASAVVGDFKRKNCLQARSPGLSAIRKQWSGGHNPIQLQSDRHHIRANQAILQDTDGELRHHRGWFPGSYS